MGECVSCEKGVHANTNQGLGQEKEAAIITREDKLDKQEVFYKSAGEGIVTERKRTRQKTRAVRLVEDLHILNKTEQTW